MKLLAAIEKATDVIRQRHPFCQWVSVSIVGDTPTVRISSHDFLTIFDSKHDVLPSHFRPKANDLVAELNGLEYRAIANDTP